MDASLATHATIGMLSDYLRRRAKPTRAEIDHIVSFCLATLAAAT